MSQQDNSKAPSQHGITQPIHAATSLPYQIAYIQVPASGAGDPNQPLRALPVHIVPFLAGGQMQGLQMHQLAQLVQNQQAQAALLQEAGRQGTAALAGQPDAASRGQASLLNLDPAMRAALAAPAPANTGTKGSAAAAQAKSLAGQQTTPTSEPAVNATGAAATAPAAAATRVAYASAIAADKPAAAEDTACAATQQGGQMANQAPQAESATAATAAVMAALQAAAAVATQNATAAAAAATTAMTTAIAPAFAQQQQRQHRQQGPSLDLSSAATDTTAGLSIKHQGNDSTSRNEEVDAAVAAAASQIPAAAAAAIAAAEAAAAARAAAAEAAATAPLDASAAAQPAAVANRVQQQQPIWSGSVSAQQRPKRNSRASQQVLVLDSDLDIDDNEPSLAKDDESLAGQQCTVAARTDAAATAAAAAAAGKIGLDSGDAAANAAAKAWAALGPEEPQEPTEREQRLQQRKRFNLKRKFADLTAQMEGALCEARAMSAWKQAPRATKAPCLEESERRQLAAARARRLAELAAKPCLAVIKALMAHKFAYPFNSPVDVTKYHDYLNYIKTPMDFGTMKIKAEEGRYADPAEMWADTMLVFDNARTYNPPTEDVYYMATVLQEYFQERWLKLVVPKLHEDAKASKAEEDQARMRKAAHARASAEAAAQEAACRLVAHLDDLHEQLGQLRVQAALCSEPLAAAARIELTAGLESLPTKQLEAALGLVMPRIIQGLTADDKGCMDVEVDLSRCSALELRQLQDFVAKCQEANECDAHASSSKQEQQQPQQLQGDQIETAGSDAAAAAAPEAAGATGAADAGAPQAADPSGHQQQQHGEQQQDQQDAQQAVAATSEPHVAAAVSACAEADRAAATAAAAADGRRLTRGQEQQLRHQQQQQAAADDNAAAAPAGVVKPPTDTQDTADVPNIAPVPAPAAAAAGGGGGGGSSGAAAATPSAVATGGMETPFLSADGARSVSGFPLAGLYEASLSERAGIVWPGQLIGSGLKARSRLLLPGQLHQPPAPAVPAAAMPAAAVAASAVAASAGQVSVLARQPAPSMLGKRRSSETGCARPPLPPAARPGRLLSTGSITGNTAAGAGASAFAQGAATASASPHVSAVETPFAVQAIPLVAPGTDITCGLPPVVQASAAGSRQHVADAMLAEQQHAAHSRPQQTVLNEQQPQQHQVQQLQQSNAQQQQEQSNQQHSEHQQAGQQQQQQYTPEPLLAGSTAGTDTSASVTGQQRQRNQHIQQGQTIPLSGAHAAAAAPADSGSAPAAGLVLDLGGNKNGDQARKAADNNVTV